MAGHRSIQLVLHCLYFLRPDRVSAGDVFRRLVSQIVVATADVLTRSEQHVASVYYMPTVARNEVVVLQLQVAAEAEIGVQKLVAHVVDDTIVLLYRQTAVGLRVVAELVANLAEQEA